MLHDRRQHRRLQLAPVAVLGLCHGDEIGAEKDAADLGKLKQPLGERRARGRAAFRKIRGSGFHDGAAGQEFQRRRVRRLLGLNEHRRLRERRVKENCA